MINPSRAYSLKVATLVTLALGLTLTGCAATSENSTVAPVPSVSASSTPEPVETSISTPIETSIPAPVVSENPVIPVTPETPVEPSANPVVSVKTFTFPDGHISFDYPSTWSVSNVAQIEETSHTVVVPNDGSAYVSDENGTVVALISSNFIGGAVSGPVNRTIFDSQIMPEFPDERGDVWFSFAQEIYPDGMDTRYFMAVVPDIFMGEGPDSPSASSVIIAPNGGAGGYVFFDDMKFGSADEAKSWMQTEKYQQLKTMLTSLRYV